MCGRNTGWSNGNKQRFHVGAAGIPDVLSINSRGLTLVGLITLLANVNKVWLV